MDTQRVERALIEEILDEMKDQRYTNQAMQEAAGIKARTWTNYKSMKSPIRIDALNAIAAVLGMRGSDLMRRAEARAANEADPLEAELVAGLSRRNRKVVESDTAARPQSSERATRKRRSS